MEVSITKVTCFQCNVPFWLLDEHQEKLVKCKNIFYCPNGHTQSYVGESDKEKLKRIEQSLVGERVYSESLVRSNAALRGVITKKKNKEKAAALAKEKGCQK